MKSAPKKAVFNWSGGKDSALALQKVIKDDEFEVVALLTTFDKRKKSSTIHDVPFDLIQKQAECIEIDLYPIFLAKDYEDKMKHAVNHFKSKGVTHFIFGDLYLEEVKKYREKQLNPLGIKVVTPLWGKTPQAVMKDFLNSGIQTKIVTTQANKLDGSFIGKLIDAPLVKSFPDDIDVCGENGEYHTFAYAGDLFQKKIEFEIVGKHKVTYDFRLDTGEMKSFEYWQAKFKD